MPFCSHISADFRNFCIVHNPPCSLFSLYTLWKTFSNSDFSLFCLFFSPAQPSCNCQATAAFSPPQQHPFSRFTLIPNVYLTVIDVLLVSRVGRRGERGGGGQIWQRYDPSCLLVNTLQKHIIIIIIIIIVINEFNHASFKGRCSTATFHRDYPQWRCSLALWDPLQVVSSRFSFLLVSLPLKPTLKAQSFTLHSWVRFLPNPVRDE